MANEELDKMIPDYREKATSIMGRAMVGDYDFREDYYALRQLAKAIVDLNEKHGYTSKEIRALEEIFYICVRKLFFCFFLLDEVMADVPSIIS